MLGLKVTRIWSHNPKAMDNTTRLNEIYFKKPIIYIYIYIYIYISNETNEDNQQWGGDFCYKTFQHVLAMTKFTKFIVVSNH